MGDVLSFAELIEALRRGDPQAVAELERLYGRHLRRVVGRKLRQMGVKSLADSVEICQDVWLRILQRPLTAAFATPWRFAGLFGDDGREQSASVAPRRVVATAR
jgi:hypothetical protein